VVRWQGYPFISSRELVLSWRLCKDIKMILAFRGNFVHTPSYGQMDMLLDKLVIVKEVSHVIAINM
jgi:hypothetical protein